VNIDALIPDLAARLIEALQDELRQYGEMLALLEQQQEHVTVRAADEVLHSVVAINEQSARIQQARRKRDECQHAVAVRLQCTDDPGFGALVPMLPEAYRSAVAELVRENNDLLVRVQQRARQNHLLLSRSLELMQRFIHGLTASGPPATYSGHGVLQANSAPPLPIYEAVG
jgi:flagellar biosynthesis/type III secretory pathway chaperone